MRLHEEIILDVFKLYAHGEKLCEKMNCVIFLDVFSGLRRKKKCSQTIPLVLHKTDISLFLCQPSSVNSDSVLIPAINIFSFVSAVEKAIFPMLKETYS